MSKKKINTVSKMFDELKTRSFIGKLYCKYYLYPKITNYLNGHLLDYGAGIGNYSLYYKKFNIVTPAEINPMCLEYMKKINLDPIRIFNDTLDVKDSIYDCAILDNVLEHTIKPLKVIREISRVVKKNKIIIIGVPGKKGYDLDWDHKTFINEAEINKFCNNLGLKINSIFYTPLFKSDILSKNLRQYCIYAVIENTKKTYYEN